MFRWFRKKAVVKPVPGKARTESAPKSLVQSDQLPAAQSRGEAPDGGEKSMEAILASIRRIVSDEDGATQTTGPDTETDAGAVSPMLLNIGPTKPRILVHENTRSQGMLFKDFLEAFGAICVGTSGYEISDIDSELGTFHYDLVITDTKLMADDTLANMVESIRKLNRYTPVVVTSAFRFKGTDEELIESGADLIIRKPDGLKDMIKQIRNLLRRRRHHLFLTYEFGELSLNRLSGELRKRGASIELDGALYTAVEELFLCAPKAVPISRLLHVSGLKSLEPLKELFADVGGASLLESDAGVRVRSLVPRASDKPDVFISYARSDKAIVERLVEELERRGLRVFYDVSLEVGAGWLSELQLILDRSACVAVCWSDASVGSHFVLEEALRGLKANKLLPVQLVSVDPPFGFASLHAVSLSDWSENGIDELVKRALAFAAARDAPSS